MMEYQVSAPGAPPVAVVLNPIDLLAGWAENAASDEGVTVRLRGKGAFNRDRSMRAYLFYYLEEEG